MINFDAVKTLVTSKTARQVLLARKHSPQALFIAGTVGVIGATVLACRATLKMDEVLENYEKEYANLVSNSVDTVLDSSQDLAEVERNQKKVNKLKLTTALDIAKLYAPAVGLGLLSIGALTGSHVIITKRNGAVMAAYAGIDRAYREYRSRVSDEYGQDVDRKFASGAETVLVEEKLADGKTKTTATTAVKKDGKFSGSPYAFLFDQTTTKKFTREPGMNGVILGVQQSHANNKLRANGHLFLNEVLDMLGLERTPAGAITGWLYRHDNEEKNGDNYVSFGIFNGDLERGEAFVAGQEDSVWLDFNVDGVIYDKI